MDYPRRPAPSPTRPRDTWAQRLAHHPSAWGHTLRANRSCRWGLPMPRHQCADDLEGPSLRMCPRWADVACDCHVAWVSVAPYRRRVWQTGARRMTHRLGTFGRWRGVRRPGVHVHPSAGDWWAKASSPRSIGQGEPAWRESGLLPRVGLRGADGGGGARGRPKSPSTPGLAPAVRWNCTGLTGDAPSSLTPRIGRTKATASGAWSCASNA